MKYRIIFMALIMILLLQNSNADLKNILQLRDNDFPQILSKHSLLFIQFISPNCKYCNQFAKQYEQLQTSIQNHNISIKLGIMNIADGKNTAVKMGVKTFPTFVFFKNQQSKIYTGPRKYTSILFWLTKQINPPLIKITAQQYQNLQILDNNTLIIYHGDLQSSNSKEQIRRLAVLDNYNQYFWGINLTQDRVNNMQMMISDNQNLFYTKQINYNQLKLWVEEYSIPKLILFDELAISYIFSDKKPALVLFDTQNRQISDMFYEFANRNIYKFNNQRIIATKINRQSRHYTDLSKFIKIDCQKIHVVLIMVQQSQKIVIQGLPTFSKLQKLLKGQYGYKFGLTEQIEGKYRYQNDDL